MNVLLIFFFVCVRMCVTAICFLPSDRLQLIKVHLTRLDYFTGKRYKLTFFKIWVEKTSLLSKKIGSKIYCKCLRKKNMKRKLKLRWSTIPPILTKHTRFTSHLKSLNTKKGTTTFDVGNPGPGLRWAQTCLLLFPSVPIYFFN